MDVEEAGTIVSVSSPVAIPLTVTLITYMESLVFEILSTLVNKATPLEMVTVKSLVVKSPLPFALANTSSENVNVTWLLSLLIVVPEIVGRVLSMKTLLASVD